MLENCDQARHIRITPCVIILEGGVGESVGLMQNEIKSTFLLVTWRKVHFKDQGASYFQAVREMKVSHQFVSVSQGREREDGRIII